MRQNSAARLWRPDRLFEFERKFSVHCSARICFVSEKLQKSAEELKGFQRLEDQNF